MRMTESGEVIRDYRHGQEPRMPQEVLAAKVGVTKATLSRIESGKLPLTLDVALKISAATGIPMRKLMPELADKFDQQPSRPEGVAS